MDDLIGVHDLLDDVTSFLVVHRPDLLYTLLVGFFKLLEAFLKLDELFSEELVALSVLRI